MGYVPVRKFAICRGGIRVVGELAFEDYQRTVKPCTGHRKEGAHENGAQRMRKHTERHPLLTCSHRHSGTSPCKQCKQPVRKPAFVQAERELCEIEQHMAAALIPLAASVSRIHHSLGDHASGAVQLAAEVTSPLLLCALLLSTAVAPDERLPQQPARRWQARHTTMAGRCRRAQKALRSSGWADPVPHAQRS